MEVITPTSHEHWLGLRSKDITSTEVSALFDCNPYMTKYELFHRKVEDRVVVIEENERMKWGKRLEDAIAWAVAEENGWKIRRMDEYIRVPDDRIGASFDFAIGDDGILEVKNVDRLVFMNNWIQNEDGSHEAPPHIEFQVQHQLLVSGRTFAYIAALVGGNELILIRREAMPDIQQKIIEQVDLFWHAVETGNAPLPDYDRDAEFITSIYDYAEPGKKLNANDRVTMLADDYKLYADAEKEAKKGKERVKAMILEEIGDAEKVAGEDFTITAGVVGPAQVSYERKGYRNFKVSFKKKKKEQSNG